MQLGGIGNVGLGSQGHSHQVTNCIHDHDLAKEKTGGAPMTLATSDSGPTELQVSQELPELLDALKNVFQNGRSLFGKVWGWDAKGAEEGQSEVASADAGVRITGTVVSPNVQMPSKQMLENPYFTEPMRRNQTVPQRIRARIRDISGRFGQGLGRHLSEFSNFSNKSDLKDRRQDAKEDLRKKSRYRERDVEFDCILMDDSYLLDSYDKKGEYSRLTTERRQ